MLEKTTDPYYVRLKNRGLIHIEGADRKNFLQGIITNDINTAAQGQILYSCLLTPQGKFLHDFFIHEGEDFLLLDCEGGERAQDLYKKLSIYKLRSDVQLSVETEHPVYAAKRDTLRIPCFKFLLFYTFRLFKAAIAHLGVARVG